VERFDYSVKGLNSQMLVDNIQGRNNSWAIRWLASALLADKLTLYPNVSLVQNIGFDGTGAHCKHSENFYDVILSENKINMSQERILENPRAVKEFKRYFRIINHPFTKAKNKLKRLIGIG
jgi:hypothetical protein